MLLMVLGRYYIGEIAEKLQERLFSNKGVSSGHLHCDAVMIFMGSMFASSDKSSPNDTRAFPVRASKLKVRDELFSNQGRMMHTGEAWENQAQTGSDKRHVF